MSPARRSPEGVDEAHALLRDLDSAGIDYDDVTATLESKEC